LGEAVAADYETALLDRSYLTMWLAGQMMLQ